MLGFFTFIASFAIAYGMTLWLLRTRLAGRFADIPNERSSHDAPKPRFGGIAIFTAFAFSSAVAAAVDSAIIGYWPLFAGGAVVFGVGVVDDRRSVAIPWRLGAQLAAAGIVVAGGHVVHELSLPLGGVIPLGVVAVPFTFFLIVASINFYNFVDGIDGLAAGGAAIGAAFMAAIAFLQGHASLGLVCLAVSGASFGFLQFNFPPSRLFMGDSGSTFLGFTFAAFAVVGSGLAPAIPVFVPVLILSSLYLDAALTLLRRALRGERIFRPHRTHYYQRLLSLGLNHKQVTVVEYALIVLLGSCALVFFEAGGLFPLFVTTSWVVVFAVLILKIRSLERGDSHLWERRTALVIAGDLVLIAAAYFGAYFLRMNFRFSEAEGMAVLKAFPIVLVVRSVCFYYYGLYRGMWKYTSTPDVVRIVKATTMGSAAIMVLLVLFYRFVAFPRSLFVIEYFLLIVLIGGARFASRLFHEYGREALGANPRRIAVIGAGDYAERLAREIRASEGKRVTIACFVDDDPRKIGLSLHGVAIDGPIDDLAAICRKRAINGIVLGITDLDDSRAGTVVREARAAGVPIDARDGLYVHKPRPARVLFDRINRAANRSLPIECRPETRNAYRNRRVLITGGGDEVGPGLARALVGAGADVVVQLSSNWEVERYRGISEGQCRVYVGSIERELDVARVLDKANPDLIFHTVSARVAGNFDSTGSTWRAILRTTDAVCRILSGRPQTSLVMVTCWADRTAHDPTVAMAAVAEALVLNAPELAKRSPRAIRIPRVLTEDKLRGAIGQWDPDARAARYGVLEPEAAALCMELGVFAAGRALVVPKPLPAILGASIPALLGTDDSLRPAFDAAGQSSGDSALPVHPAERLAAASLPGLAELRGPLYPADEVVAHAVRECTGAVAADAVEAPLAGLRSRLREKARVVRVVD